MPPEMRPPDPQLPGPSMLSTLGRLQAPSRQQAAGSVLAATDLGVLAWVAFLHRTQGSQIKVRQPASGWQGQAGRGGLERAQGWQSRAAERGGKAGRCAGSVRLRRSERFIHNRPSWSLKSLKSLKSHLGGRQHALQSAQPQAQAARQSVQRSSCCCGQHPIPVCSCRGMIRTCKPKVLGRESGEGAAAGMSGEPQATRDPPRASPQSCQLGRCPAWVACHQVEREQGMLLGLGFPTIDASVTCFGAFETRTHALLECRAVLWWLQQPLPLTSSKHCGPPGLAGERRPAGLGARRAS